MSDLSREQLQNAALIYQVGKAMGLGTRDIQIGLITAMQESTLRNVNYGDRDSLGLFQQRPSQGWGTPAQVTNPEYAARKFFTELKALGESRFDMSMTEAAQAVQRSAYPDAYAKHIGLVRSIYPSISGAEVRGSTPDDFDLSSPAAQPPNAVDGMELLSADYNPLLGAPQLGLTGGSETWSPIISPGTNDIVADKMPFQKGVDGWRQAVVEAARQYLGTPYVWGGSGPDGLDCSGLVQLAFSQAGIDLPRVSYQQANSGKRVGLKGLRPGDLVAWDNSARNNGADHIAIYIGDNQIIEAPKPGLGVRVRSLSQGEGAYGVRMQRG